jgi:CelD/BcsL family acetyltransferase involved in cellulose biosynthesis
LEHFGDLVPHRFAVGRTECGRVYGICLLTEGIGRSDGPFAVKSVHLGTAGEPDGDSVCLEWNCLLAEQIYRINFAQQLCLTLAGEQQWDEVCLDGFAKADAGELLAVRGLDRTRLHVREIESFYFDLCAAREAGSDALSALGYATRKNIRKNLKAYGALRTEWAESVAAAESIFDDLVRLHQARWNAVGKPGSYASRRFLEFHRSLIPRLVPQGQMGLFRVTAGEEIVGCVQVLIDRNRALCYQGGSAPYTDKLSPGVIVDYLCIEECLRRGFDAYDFLGGDAHHKQKLSTNSHAVVWVSERRPRWKFAAVAAGRRLKQCLQIGERAAR